MTENCFHSRPVFSNLHQYIRNRSDSHRNFIPPLQPANTHCTWDSSIYIKWNVFFTINVCSKNRKRDRSTCIKDRYLSEVISYYSWQDSFFLWWSDTKYLLQENGHFMEGTRKFINTNSKTAIWIFPRSEDETRELVYKTERTAKASAVYNGTWNTFVIVETASDANRYYILQYPVLAHLQRRELRAYRLVPLHLETRKEVTPNRSFPFLYNNVVDFSFSWSVPRLK